MHKARVGLILASLLAVALGTLAMAHAEPTTSGNTASAFQHQSLVQSVRVWRDCQRIALCNACRPVYHCRSCNYQKKCKWGICEWADVCVWGPYLPLAPRGVPIR
jgi:hypothetical protein